MWIYEIENLGALFGHIYLLSCLIEVVYAQIDLFVAQWSPTNINFQTVIAYFPCIGPKYFMVNEED